MPWRKWTARNPSPLLPLRRFLTFARFAGCPLIKKDDRMIFFGINRWSYLGVLFKVSMLLGGFSALNYMVRDQEIVEFAGALDKLQETNSISMTENLAMNLGFLPSLLSMVYYVVVFKKMQEPLSQFCEAFTDYNEVLLEEGQIKAIFGHRAMAFIQNHVLAFACSILCAVGFLPFSVVSLKGQRSRSLK